jgi:hypothetical protein
MPRLAPPSIPAVVFALLAVLVPLGLQRPLLNSDGDLARHLRHGRYMLEHGTVIRQDPFSFTRPAAPYVGFEYGSQLLYAMAERAGGLPGVALLAGILIAATYALLGQWLLKQQVDPLLAYLTVALAAVLGVGHWTARPHLFSYLAVVLLLAMLERRPARLVPLTGALFLLWVNLHGGFVYGLTLIGLYLAGSLAEMILGDSGPAWKERVISYIKVLAAASAVSILNPYGLDLPRHLLEFFGKRYLFDNTAEFTSPDFHEAAGKIFLAVLLLCFTSTILSARRPSLPRLFTLLAGTAFALISVRNIPLFGLTVLPLLAIHLDADWRRLPDPRGFRHRFAITASRTSTWPWVVSILTLLCLLGAFRGRIGSTTLLSDGFDGSTFPVDAVRHARAEKIGGRLFTEFAWGGYVLYAWPEQKVFIDGGTDFYGPELFQEYATIKRLVPGWRGLLGKWDLSLMLLRRESSLAHELSRDPRWAVWYCDSLSVLLKRAAVPEAIPRLSPDSSELRLQPCASKHAGGASRPQSKTDE